MSSVYVHIDKTHKHIIDATMITYTFALMDQYNELLYTLLVHVCTAVLGSTHDAYMAGSNTSLVLPSKIVSCCIKSKRRKNQSISPENGTVIPRAIL